MDRFGLGGGGDERPRFEAEELRLVSTMVLLGCSWRSWSLKVCLVFIIFFFLISGVLLGWSWRSYLFLNAYSFAILVT